MSGSDEARVPAQVSRQTARSGTWGTLDRVYEVREIVLAQGVEATNAHFDRGFGPGSADADATYGGIRYIDLFKIPNNQTSIMDRVTMEPATHDGVSCYEYRSEVQRVLYRLYVVNTKEDYKRWIETPGVHVIYSGHARYGRGACFGDSTAPGDRWEDGTGCTTGNPSRTDGLLRLGYPIVGVPISDVAHHRYHTSPVQAEPAIDPVTCHPDVVSLAPIRRMRIDPSLDVSELGRNSFEGTREDWGLWKWDRDSEMIRIGPKAPFDLRSLIYEGDPDGDLWGYRLFEGGHYKLHILLHAGWRDTISEPWDLGSVNLQCKVFCHFGCSTLKHFYPILRGRDQRSWRRGGEGRDEDRFAYWTSRTSNATTTPLWLSWLFRYPRRNDFRSWGPSIEWARRRTNRELGVRFHCRYKII